MADDGFVAVLCCSTLHVCSESRYLWSHVHRWSGVICDALGRHPDTASLFTNATQGMYTQASVKKTVWNVQGRAWRAWLEYIEDRHAAKAKIQNAAAFWQNRQAALAFQQWQEQVQIAHEMKAKAAVIIGRLRNSAQVWHFCNIV